MVSIFADKTTIILRKMLKNPKRAWVIQDFVKTKDAKFGVGQGRVAQILNEMDRLGYIERVKRGAKSQSLLTNTYKLIGDWLKAYKFEYNEVYSFYSHQKDIQKRIKEFLETKDIDYAFTLHTAANLSTSFVKTEEVHLYLNAVDIKKNISDIRQNLGLKQLVQGGNIHFVKPYYKHSVFFNVQKIKGYKTVSNLQLYLDLYHFQPRGQEHAEYLKEFLEGKGKNLD